MGLGSRLFRVVRANVSHYVREATGRLLGRRDDEAAGAGPSEPFTGDATRPTPGSGANRFAREYALLEIPVGAGRDAVRAAHRSLMRRYHPDRFARDPDGLADATRLAQEITAARDRILAAIEHGEIADADARMP